MLTTKSVCTYPGCRCIVDRGRCQRHAKENRSHRNGKSDPFYSSHSWRKLRALKISADPCCEDCAKRGLVKAADEVHHVVARSVDASIAMDIDNLMSLCKTCHSRRTVRER